MKTFILSCLLILSAALSSRVFASSQYTFDWKGNSTNWASPGSWTESGGGSGDYPGSGGRTNDIVRFGVSSTNYIVEPTLSTSVTVASIEFGGAVVTLGTTLTVNGATLTVTGEITQDINTTRNTGTYDLLTGTGTIVCAGIQVGSGTSISGNNNYMLSDIATLHVTGNVDILSNVNTFNASGFRLENGSMYLDGQIIIHPAASSLRSTSTNASYFTINTTPHFLGLSITTPKKCGVVLMVK